MKQLLMYHILTSLQIPNWRWEYSAAGWSLPRRHRCIHCQGNQWAWRNWM